MRTDKHLSHITYHVSQQSHITTMQRRHKINLYRIPLIALTTLFVTVQFFAFPSIAKAQLVVSDPALLGLETTREVKTTFTNTLLAAGLGALINGASYFMRKLAYDTARFVASGGKGQGALAFKDGFGEYLRKEGLNSASSAIEQFGAPFGLNLCKPPDIRLQVFLQVGLRSIYDLDFGLQGEGGPQPACKWSDFSRDWGAAIENPGAYGKDLITENFAASINVSQTDFGVALGFQNKVDRIVSQGQIGASNERLEGQGFKPLTGLISGKVKTPAQVISEETKAVTGKHQGELSAGQIAGIYGSGAAQILPMAAGVFLNTLVSQLLNNLLTEGLFPDTPGGGAGGGAQGGGFGGQFAGPLSINRERAEAAFSFLFTAVPTKELSSFNIAQLAACPDSPGIYNCVIDTAFQQAIERARTKPLTIREAIEQNLFHGDWPLISPRREVDNTNVKGCRDKGYCYSNLQKLRKLRIVPLGFEIAALNADPDNLEVWTLKKVVDSFEDCARDGFGNAVADPTHPFCHLIDPNWIIKAPDARCEAEGYGNQLAVAGGAERLKECLDVSTCVKEGPNGTCESFSYCTREKNVWKIPGKACAAYNATCRTYVDDNNQIASYLSRTLDFGECTAESVGCRAYSAEQRAGAWQNSNQAQAQLALKALGRSQTVYFNDQIQNQTCPSSADGCSALYEALLDGEKGALAYFKKAPDYLGCYDIDPRTPEINFPSTEAELVLLRNKPAECANFSSACIPEEVACELYTPEDGGVEVTGIVGGNVCASECVGYDAYKQEATNFESAKFPLYFVPSNGRACEARNVGCDEFTNLDNPRGGGELREYYSDLKYCEKPAGGNGKTFYSWEGSEREGYVLRRHTLLQVNEAARAYIDGLGVPQAVKDAFPLGSAAYYDDSPASLTSNYEICNQANYNILVNNPNSLDAAHPDCRALYDDQGAISYRMLTKTVTVSDQCHRLRKTESELYVDASLAGNQAGCSAKGGQLVNNQCQRCFNGGVLEGAEGNKSCIYKGIVAESASCPASANQCRSYIGNTGNNIQEVYFTSFEPAGEGQNALSDAKAGWDIDARVRPEATQVGLYSLEVSQGSTLRTFPAGTFEPGAWYELTFWAKGVQQNFQVALLQNGQEFRFHEANLSFGPSWREYRVGPVQFTGNGNQEVVLSFVGFGGAVYYLDNVRLTKFTDHIYLIKNSWRTPEGFDAPLTCDSIPNDGFPGEALGCRAYKDGAGERVTFTGFEKLCRAEAVGCRPFYDTKNTIEEAGVVAFNLWCRGNPGTCTIGQNLGSCTVPQGERGCYVEKVVMPADVDTVAEMSHPQLQNAEVRPATIIVPADTLLDDPVYLARRQEFICSAEHLGCQKVALEEQVLPTAQNATSYQFSDTYLKAGDPKHYETTLCSDTAVGCGEFKSGNEIVYFKDPRIVGNKLCAYLPSRGEGQNQRAGWYLEGVGKCSNNPANLCRTNEECGAGNTCDLREPVACYPDYVLDDNEYGMWSQRTPNYAGYVGQCPLEENGCSEFLDPADVSDINPQGKPYYVIVDEALNRNVSECNGRVSQKEGCVLFDRTDIPNKLYEAQATYAASENAPVKYAFVSPVPTPRNNTNVILKVSRDRECSEWLDCKTSASQFDENLGKRVSLCYELRSCRRLGTAGECLDWIPDERLNTETLSQSQYINRNTSWYGEEYTAFSLLGKYQLSNYTTIVLGGDPIFYLAYKMPSELLQDFPLQSCQIVVNEANGRQTIQNKQDFNTKCGPDFGGRCYTGSCVYPLDGVFPANVGGVNNPSADQLIEIQRRMKETLEQGSCKAFPESDSPYPSSIVARNNPEKLPAVAQDNQPQRFEYPDRMQNYSRANVCNGISGSICSCEYKKVEYKSGVVDYWPAFGTNSQIIPKGVCQGSGTEDGLPCTDNGQCAPGVCSTKKGESKFFGQRGFCLERDISRPFGKDNFACMTWLPVDTAASRLDNNNASYEAGYLPLLDAVTEGQQYGQTYCTDSNANGGHLHAANHFVELGGNKSYSGYRTELQSVVGGEEGGPTHHDFSWLHDKPFSTDFLYTYTQWWAWDTLGPNSTVLWTRAPQDWMNFHDQTWRDCSRDINEGVPCYQDLVQRSHNGAIRNIVIRPDAFSQARGDAEENRQRRRNRGDSESVVNTPQIGPVRHNNPEVAVGSDIFPFEVDFYADEIKKIHFVPFIVVGGLNGAGGPCTQRHRADDQHEVGDCAFVGRRLYVTDKVVIDIERLRESEDELQNGVEVQRNVMVETDDIDEKPYDFYYTLSGPGRRLDPNFGNEDFYTFRAVLSSDDPEDYISPFLLKIIYGSIIVTEFGEHDFDAKIFPCMRKMIHKQWPENPVGHCGFDGLFNRFQEYSNGQLNDLSIEWVTTPLELVGGALPWGPMGIVVESRSMCTEFAKVHDDEFIQADSATQNKAWTDRVWNNAPANIANIARNPRYTAYVAIQRETPLTPYASLDIDDESFNNLGTVVQQTYRHPFNEKDVDSMPFACQATFVPGHNPYLVDPITGLSPFIGVEAEQNICAGISGPGYDHVDRENITNFTHLANFNDPGDPVTGRRVLEQLFMSGWTKDIINGAGAVDNRAEPWDRAGDAQYAGQGIVPQIYAINSASCQSGGESVAVRCKPAEPDNFSIEGKNASPTLYPPNGFLADYNGDAVPDEDNNRNGIPDPIIERENVEATMRFFAIADDNRMPIRRVKVDWGDGFVLNENSLGFSKNRKPYCAPQGSADNARCRGTQLTCQDASDCQFLPGSPSCDQTTRVSFGDAQERGCEETYFEFEHNYTCQDGDGNPKTTVAALDGLPGVNLDILREAQKTLVLMDGVEETTPVCVFRPKVQVLDNWGWCNGNCRDAGGGQRGCYNDLGIRGESQCDSGKLFNSWTEYKGAIFVIKG